MKPQFCRKKNPDCKEQLSAANKSGYCNRHIYLTYRPPVERKPCKEPDCKELLTKRNKSGYCAIHAAQHYSAEHAAELREAARKRTASHRVRRRDTLAELAAAKEQLIASAADKPMGRRGRHKKTEDRKQSTKIGRAVDAAIPRFAGLLEAVPKSIKGNHESLKRSFAKDGLPREEIEACIAGIRSRTAISTRPLVAARYYVSLTMGTSFDLVGEYHREYRRIRLAQP